MNGSRISRTLSKASAAATLSGRRDGRLLRSNKGMNYRPDVGPAWRPLMNSFFEHHKDSIRWHYRCFDRILLNGLIQPFQQPERVVGFFNTYRQVYPVSRQTLRGVAEQFQSWLKDWSEKRKIPVLEPPDGRRD